jgi:DNA uptake protein ComE-like DNA-binding protein
MTAKTDAETKKANEVTALEGSAAMYGERRNLNTVTKSQMGEVSFLTNRRADLILSARAKRPGGKFTSYGEVRHITGIGEGIFNLVADNFFIEGAPDDPYKAHDGLPAQQDQKPGT